MKITHGTGQKAQQLGGCTAFPGDWGSGPGTRVRATHSPVPAAPGPSSIASSFEHRIYVNTPTHRHTDTCTI